MEQNKVNWIDEMFAAMKKDRAAASSKRNADGTRVHDVEHHAKQVAGAANAWSALVSSITNDVNDFNKHEERSGQDPVRMSQRSFQCEVNLPGLLGKRLVLTLQNNDLQVTVHPNFPHQKLTVTIKLDRDGQHASWVLADHTKESTHLSVEQLSEYLLKPILSCANISADL
jgi:hypothetical protein